MNGPLESTRTFESPRRPPSRLTLFWQRSLGFLSNVWTSTDFDESRLTRYAENMMLAETRKGITVMALASLLIQVAALALYQKLGAQGGFLYTFTLLGLLSIHVIASVRFVTDLSALYLLGIVLLVFTGVAIMSIAHRTGSLNAVLMSSIVFLFMVMPLVPWGLREAGLVVGLTYTAFTFSLLSVAGRFEAETLWTVQFLIVTSAATAMLIIARNTIVRKDDIRAKFQLEDAHRELQQISTCDPLTGARNRRFIEQSFDGYARGCYDGRQAVQLALLDIDDFKYFNDTYGHHHGDEILKHLANVFIESLPGNSHLIRLGGDEFAVVYSGDGLKRLVRRCLDHLYTDPVLLRMSDGLPVTVAVGFAAGPLDQAADLTELYKQADEALYEAKSRREQTTADERRLAAELYSTGAVRVKA